MTDPLSIIVYKNKGYGANHTLLWQARETLSVKLLFCWLRQPKTLVDKCVKQ